MTADVTRVAYRSRRKSRSLREQMRATAHIQAKVAVSPFILSLLYLCVHFQLFLNTGQLHASRQFGAALTLTSARLSSLTR